MGKRGPQKLAEDTIPVRIYDSTMVNLMRIKGQTGSKYIYSLKEAVDLYVEKMEQEGKIIMRNSEIE